MTNRVLRFFQQPVGVYHGSIFYQLSGGVGPVALTLDAAGNLYVGQYDLKESSGDGSVFVISPAGKLLKTISTAGSEISGLAISTSSSGYVFLVCWTFGHLRVTHSRLFCAVPLTVTRHYLSQRNPPDQFSNSIYKFVCFTLRGQVCFPPWPFVKKETKKSNRIQPRESQQNRTIFTPGPW